MANLSFMSALTDQQRQYAEVIRQRAQEMGIPPDLAVAIAYQESRLNPQSKDSGKGAIGIMQVRPIAARDVGVNPEDLRDPNVNIDAGLRYLKKALTETGDPRLAVVYYNAGPGTLQAFDQGGDLPQETEQYLRSLHSFGAFTPRAEPAAGSSAEPAAEPPSGYELPPRVELQSSEQQETKNADERRLAEYVGLGAGAGLSLGRGIKEGAKGGIKGMGQALMQGLTAGAPGTGAAPGVSPAPGAAPGAPPAGLPGAPGAPGAAPMAPARTPPRGPVQLGTPGTYPTATGPGSATFNYGRVFGLPEIEAGRALGTGKAEGEVWDLLNKRQEALTTIQQRFPSDNFVENPRFGGIMTPAPSVGQGPRQSFVAPAAQPGQPTPPLQALPPRLPVSTTPPKPSGLEQVTQMFSRAAQTGLNAVKPVLAAAQRYVVPPLALAQGAGELVSAKQSMEQDDPLGAALRGLGGAGAIASVATPAALPVAVGAPLAQAFRERMAENVQRFPPDTRPLTPDEEAIASRPAFVYPRAAPRRATVY